MSDMAVLVKEANSMRDGLRVYAILNSADVRGTDNAAAAEAVSEFEGIEYLNAPIGRRKAFADAFGSGRSVWEWKPKDEKAMMEITRLVTCVFIPP